MAKLKQTAFTLTAMVAGALARLNIVNHCGAGVTVVQSQNAGCDFGPNGCIDQGNQPWSIGTGSTLNLDLDYNGASTSVKVGKVGVAGVLQYEYTIVSGAFGGMYWDLSDLDGSGPGLTGTPFFNDNVKVTPTGNGVEQGTCLVIRCYAGEVCYDSYQHPDDPNTRFCPIDTGDMWLDLCMPDDIFESRTGSTVEAFNGTTAEVHRRTSRHVARHSHLHGKGHH